MLSISVVLIVTAFVVCIMSALGKGHLRLAVVLLIIERMLALMPR
jgi:hypothetical protein